MPSTFSRSPANTNPLSASAPSPAASPQDWLKQSGALSSLGGLSLHAPGSDAAAGCRELYRVDLQVLLVLLLSMYSPMLCLQLIGQQHLYQAAMVSLIVFSVLVKASVPRLIYVVHNAGQQQPLVTPRVHVRIHGFQARFSVSTKQPDSRL